MDRKLAQDLLYVFDTPKNVEIMQSYLETEVKRVFLRLKGASDPVEIYRLQGQIAALEYIKRVREHALDIIGRS